MAFKDLMGKLQEAYRTQVVYPRPDQVFRALKLTEFEEVKVVILGQDPYHGPNQANGLAFSVPEDQPFPPSLRNIFIELQDDLKSDFHLTGDLSGWAEQGVLLLNTSLSVVKGQANSHSHLGWQAFTDYIIEALGQRTQPPVFILWGKYAQSKSRYILDKSLIIASPHPSPLSAYRGFFGSKPFSRANQLLIKQGKDPIDWTRFN